MRYFDYNATAPLSPVARQAWLRAQEDAWANPSSPSRLAARARNLLEDCRARLAMAFGIAAERVVFTSGATEGNNAVLSWVARYGVEDAPPVAAFSAVEHPSVREAARHWFDRTVPIPADPHGRVEPGAVREVIERDSPKVVSLLAAHNETGVIQPWHQVLDLCRQAGVWFHCDAVQWLGKLPLDGLAEADFVVGSGHKFGAPKGVGFILLGARHPPFTGQTGGGQEGDRRAGTEDVAGIAAMVAALEERLSRERESSAGRDEFSARMKQRGVRILSEEVERLPNTVALIMPRFDRMRWITRLERAGCIVGSGSACSSAQEGPSATLAAMGISAEEAARTLRISAGPDTTPDDWMTLSNAFASVEADLHRDQDSDRLTSVLDL